ncbi:hypothetical protein NEOLEDRAFT_1134254 [Neolentinus lepideus HHB14362 ss-1]|uniref:Uncharacterized protein n=1 Tax=Neolentinus lepideus HHB14362 ss-1 TaxID=1314782 RepID=A0A165SEB8_9AGAM|nr:hypothetical protein NEOLEDRAFT_1134254 [Neolentinus lepideus HHB14362 ss-1]
MAMSVLVIGFGSGGGRYRPPSMDVRHIGARQVPNPHNLLPGTRYGHTSKDGDILREIA